MKRLLKAMGISLLIIIGFAIIGFILALLNYLFGPIGIICLTGIGLFILLVIVVLEEID